MCEWTKERLKLKSSELLAWIIIQLNFDRLFPRHKKNTAAKRRKSFFYSLFSGKVARHSCKEFWGISCVWRNHVAQNANRARRAVQLSWLEDVRFARKRCWIVGGFGEFTNWDKWVLCHPLDYVCVWVSARWWWDFHNCAIGDTTKHFFSMHPTFFAGPTDRWRRKSSKFQHFPIEFSRTTQREKSVCSVCTRNEKEWESCTCRHRVGALLLCRQQQQSVFGVARRNCANIIRFQFW